MFGKLRLAHWLVGALVLGAVDCSAVLAIDLALTSPAHAQFRDDRYPRRYAPRSNGGFFDQLFGGGYNSRHYERDDDSRPSSAPQHIDSSKAPANAKTEKDATPSTTILVLGDGMSDWLGYGLDDAFADSPEIAVVRKDKQRSGLIRYDTKGDLDWWHAVRDILTKEKANYVVMMIGLNDRESIREKDVAKEDEKQKAEQAKIAAGKAAQKPDGAPQTQDKNQDKTADKNQNKNQDAEQDAGIIAPEPKGAAAANGIIEFRSALWAKVYSRRIDDTIAALKSKGVPVFWVGLPSIKGTKSSADAAYLNDLYRARAERAGINYIDVWDGFVDDTGKFTTFGPDYEGQTRKLRSADGVYFTKFGARKLAHYVEREIRRYMSNRALPVALPAGPQTPAPEAGKPAARPVIGPVIPLTVSTGGSDQLLGTADSRPVYGDAIANDVLVKGESVHTQPGRADDFAWQPGNLATAPAEEIQATGMAPTSKGEGESKTGGKGEIRNVSPGKPGPKDAAKDAAKPKPAAKQAEAKGPPRTPHRAPAH
jgi:hypothetical protein